MYIISYSRARTSEVMRPHFHCGGNVWKYGTGGEKVGVTMVTSVTILKPTGGTLTSSN